MPAGSASSVRQQPAGRDRIGRHEHVGDEVDHQVEHVARPARQHVGDAQRGAPACRRSPSTISATPRHTNIAVHAPRTAATSAASASAAPVAVKMWTAKARKMHQRRQFARSGHRHCRATASRSIIRVHGVMSCPRSSGRNVESHMTHRTAEVVVVGGGPAGLTAAIALARAGVATAVVARPTPGRQPHHRAARRLGHGARHAGRVAALPRRTRRRCACMRHRRRHGAAAARAGGAFCRGEIGLDAFALQHREPSSAGGARGRARALPALAIVADDAAAIAFDEGRVTVTLSGRWRGERRGSRSAPTGATRSAARPPASPDRPHALSADRAHPQSLATTGRTTTPRPNSTPTPGRSRWCRCRACARAWSG